MWPVRLRAAGLRKRTKAALPGRKRGNAVVIWSLNLLGIFRHSTFRHAVIGFRHAFLRLGLLRLGICVHRVVGLRGLLSSRAGGLGRGNRYASHKSRTAYSNNETTHFDLPVILKELPITGHNWKGSIVGTQQDSLSSRDRKFP